MYPNPRLYSGDTDGVRASQFHMWTAPSPQGVLRRGSELGYTERRIGAAKADDGTLTLSAVVRVWIKVLGQRRGCPGATARTWPFKPGSCWVPGWWERGRSAELGRSGARVKNGIRAFSC